MASKHGHGTSPMCIANCLNMWCTMVYHRSIVSPKSPAGGVDPHHRFVPGASGWFPPYIAQMLFWDSQMCKRCHESYLKITYLAHLSGIMKANPLRILRYSAWHDGLLLTSQMHGRFPCKNPWISRVWENRVGS